MARFDLKGADEFVRDLENLGELVTGELANSMLSAGAEKVQEAMKASAESHGHRETGAMIDSIRPTKPADGKVEIYPQGKDKKGTRNAEKGFILHYGTSKIKASHWVEDAERESETPAIDAMEEVFDSELRKRGL